MGEQSSDQGNHRPRDEQRSRNLSWPLLLPLAPKRINLRNLVGAAMEKLSEPGAKVIPGRNDILFGRGSGHHKHPGNVKLYEIIEHYLPQYLVAASRVEKTYVVQSIYSTLRTIGRFVRVDQETGVCFVATHEQAKSKIGHAIRYKIKLNTYVSSSGRPKSDEESLHSSHLHYLATINNVNTNQQQHPRQYLPAPRRLRQDRDEGEKEDDEICSDADLRQVIGYPGEMDIPTQIPDLESLEDGT
eukprot:scaffold14939_cov215-Amphora_coffeaeformis.AAC.7